MSLKKLFYSTLLSFCCLNAAKAEEWQKLGKFEIRGGVARDTQNRLIWSRCFLGMTWKNGDCVGEISYKTWPQAMQAAAEADYDNYQNWRLPTLAELETLRDPALGNYNQRVPFIDTRVFWLPNCNPAPKACISWTSTKHSRYSDDSWVIDFTIGYSRTKVQTQMLAVRLVRDKTY